MNDVCPSCTSRALTLDEHGGQSHLVCTACGQIMDSTTSFQQERDYWGGVTACSASGACGRGSNLGRHRPLRRGDPTTPSHALRPWLSYLREVCGVMSLPAEMERGVLDLFGRAFCADCFKFKQQERKRALCAATLYTVCRQHDWPVLLSDIAAIVQSPLGEMYAMLQLLASELNVRPMAPDIEDIVERVLKVYGLEEAAFVAKTVQVVALAKEAWLTSGRSHDPTVCAAAFLVWKSTSEGRPKGSKLQSFGERLRGRLPARTARRVREIRDILMQLARQLPWLQGKTITGNMAPLHLDDILCHKKYLMSHVKPPEEVDDDNSEDGNSKARHSTLHNGASDPRPSRPPPSLLVRGFLPPSMNQIKKRKKSSNEDSSVAESPSQLPDRTLPPDEGGVSMDKELTDRDIPESEMHFYVRSESEVAAFECMRNTVMARESADREPE